MPSIEIGDSDFLLDGEPLQIISGTVHYFRVHPSQWRDRIRAARHAGLNTVETYVAWNFHSPRSGEFETDGARDIGRFLDIVADEGMHAIVRPGPYICAEWDGGGLPAWLFDDPGVGVRRNEPKFMAAVAEYFQNVLPIVAARQVTRGGPVLMVQIENEYGAYGDDKDYLRGLVDLTRAGGIEVPLFTSDQANDEMLERGGLPELLRTGNFGSRSPERLATLRRHQPTGPLMCMEYWNGWFDSWGEDHHVTGPGETASDLGDLLASGASVNLYMFHGGTNFGFWSGANHKGVYRPIITSYDYDAPLAEDGTPTPKLEAVQEVIARHRGVSPRALEPRRDAPTPDASPRRPTTPLWAYVEQAEGWQSAGGLPTTDSIGAHQGFALYRREVDLDAPRLLSFDDVRDRAQVYLDRRPVGVIDRERGERSLLLPGVGHAVLEILVEDQGRVNYGPRIGESKGLIGPARLGGAGLVGWEILALPLDRWAAQAAPDVSARADAGPTLTAWDVAGSETADLFLSTHGWGKGVAWFNGWNLGRFWSAGPQEFLYVPGPLVREEGNELVVLELLGTANPTPQFVPAPSWKSVSD
jgi:beta-galactosidase